MVIHDSNIEPSNAGKQGFRFGLRFLFILVAVVSLVVGGGVWLNRKFDEYSIGLLVGNPGPVDNTEDWPRALKELANEAAKLTIDVEVLEVHCIQSGWDEEYLWRMRANPELLDFMKEKLELQVTDPPKWSYFAADCRPIVTELQKPSWPLPGLKESEYFACPRFVAREPSDRFEVVHDKTNQLFVVHYYFDF